MGRRIRDAATVALVVWSLNAGFAPARAQKSNSSGIPEEAQQALKKKWPDWQTATLAPALASCLPGGKPPAAIVTSDFDSDGHADLAAAIQTKQGARLVVLTWRPWGYDLYDVDAIGDQTAAASIAIASHGTKFANPITLLDDYFTSDTLTTRTCGKGGTAYFWTGVGFNRQVIPSIAAPSSTRP